MSERLLEKMGEQHPADTTLLMTPDLAETLELMERAPSDPKPRKTMPSSAGGWEAGMEVTHGVTLVKLIADGGMGSVWVADHVKLNTQVAVKLIAPALLEKQPSLVERLDIEAAALGRLSNPNVVEIFEHGTTSNGTPYIVMELLDGVTLWSVVKRHGPLSLTEVAAIVEQIANGLSAAHREGIIHRDIKPQNIFLFARGGKLAVKVIDFGIAKELEVNAISSVTKTGTLLGTPHFMSPEQLLTPKKVDARTDLWSLGVVAYHALARRFPFDGETLAHLFKNITTSTFPPPSSYCAHLPPEIDAWTKKALAREPQNRFRTARELSTSLKRVVLALDEAVSEHRVPGASNAEDALSESSSQRSQAPPSSIPRAVVSSPVDASIRPRKKKLLPYPFALMQDEATVEQLAPEPLANPDEVQDSEERLRKVLVVAAVVAVVAIVIALATN